MTARRRSMLAVFRAVLMVLVLAAVTFALVSSWDDVAPYLSELGPQGMAGITEASTIARLSKSRARRSGATTLVSAAPIAQVATGW